MADLNRLGRRVASLLTAFTLASACTLVPVCAAETAESAASASNSTVSAPPAVADASVVATNGIDGWPKAADIYSTTGCLMDADTGTVLFAKGMDQKMFPASTTKIMTCLLALEKGNLDDTVTVTQTGVNYAVSGSSNLNTQVGEQFKLRDMLYAMMLKSANDIATTIGEYIGGGSIDTFIQMMNEKAKELGCTGTHFSNACGMPDETHVTTAHDLALISQAALRYDLFRTIVHTPSYTIPATNMSPQRTVGTHMAMLVDPNYMVDGIIGGKTGYTDAAQSCLVSFVERDGRTLICVTLHASDGGYAALDHKNLYNEYGYPEFKNVEIKSSTGKSAGKVTLPADADEKDCKVDHSETTDESGEESVTITYSWNGETVGSTVMTKTDYENLEKSAEDSPSSLSEAGRQEPEEASDAEQHTARAESSLLSSLMDSTSGIIILVMGVLVFLGIVAIIATVIVKSHRR